MTGSQNLYPSCGHGVGVSVAAGHGVGDGVLVGVRVGRGTAVRVGVRVVVTVGDGVLVGLYGVGVGGCSGLIAATMYIKTISRIAAYLINLMGHELDSLPRGQIHMDKHIRTRIRMNEIF